MPIDNWTLLHMGCSFLVACICVWAVLTARIRTTSLEILALFILFVGAMLNIEAPLYTGALTKTGWVLTIIGIVLYGVFGCLRLTLKPWIDNLYRRLHIEERLQLRRSSDHKEKP